MHYFVLVTELFLIINAMSTPLTVVFSQANHSVRNFTVYTRIHGISQGNF